MVKTVELQPADIFASRGHGWLSKAIRFFTRRIGEPRTLVNHVGIVVSSGTVKTAIIVEALSRVRRHKLILRYGGKKASNVAIFRPLNLTEEEKGTIVRAAEEYVNRKYGFLKLLAHLADWVLLGAYVFRRVTAMDKYPICSWLVAHAFKKAGKHFGVPPGAASPDDIWDFVHLNPDKYKTVVELGPLSRFLGATPVESVHGA